MLSEIGLDPEVGIKITKDGEINELDVCVIKGEKLYIIECKDTSDDDFLNNLVNMVDIADKYILVSTKTPKPKTLRTAKTILKRKFSYVPPHQISKLASKIK